MYLSSKAAGSLGEIAIWQLIESKLLIVQELDADGLEATRAYMTAYRDVPCDFADATILVLCERLDQQSVLTLDSDFYAYRVNGMPLNLIPGPLPR